MSEVFSIDRQKCKKCKKKIFDVFANNFRLDISCHNCGELFIRFTNNNPQVEEKKDE